MINIPLSGLLSGLWLPGGWGISDHKLNGASPLTYQVPFDCSNVMWDAISLDQAFCKPSDVGATVALGAEKANTHSDCFIYPG